MGLSFGVRNGVHVPVLITFLLLPYLYTTTFVREARVVFLLFLII